MNYCPQLEEIKTLNDYRGNFEYYNDYLYEIFKSDLYNNKLIYRGRPVSLKKYPENDGKEFSFLHLTSKDFQHTGNEDERLPDLRRCERLHWIKPGIETNHLEKCKQDCFLTYIKPYKNKDRYHLLNYEDRYMIVLEDRKKYFLLITAYYIEYDNTLERKLKEYQKYREWKIVKNTKCKKRPHKSRGAFEISFNNMVDELLILYGRKSEK